ncbi:hypothetical protein DIPPA_01808 [Diplonema papillatum]|nr:hypothetical protein DIPPA_01808 [Diplonema papillatum]
MDTDLAFGAVFRIDEEATPGTDRNHVIAALEAGEWVVAWSSVNEQTGETSVRSRKVDYLRTLGEEKFHDSLSADAQVAGHENGGYVVAYGVDTQWFSSGGLKLKFYDSDDKFIDERSVPYDIHVDGVPDSPHRTLLATGLIHIGYNDYALSFTIINGDSLAGATLHPFMASTIISWL